MTINSPEFNRLPIEQRITVLMDERAKAEDGAMSAPTIQIQRRQEERAKRLQAQLDQLCEELQ